MVLSPKLDHGSHVVRSRLSLRDNVPPYCGVPRLSHQCPDVWVVGVVAGALVVVVAGALVVVVVVVVVWVVVVVVVVVVGFDVVDLVQDASSSVTTIKQLKINQADFFPIIPPSYFGIRLVFLKTYF